MENTRVKKIVILVAVLLALTIVGLQFGLSNFMQAFAEPNEDVKVEFSAQVNNDKTEAKIQINATPKEQDVEITSIELPNGEVVNDTTATYKATENGKLTFTINYKLPKASSEQPFIDKEPEYEDKQQTTTYQVTGIKPITEQEAQSSPSSTTEGNLESVTENNPHSNPENTPGNEPESSPDSAPEGNTSTPVNNLNSPPALQQPSTNGALQQNNLGDTSNAYTPDNAFTITADGTITAYDQKIGGSDVVIPQYINGIPVRAIGVGAFYNKRLTSVTLPEGLLRIGESAFGYNKITRELKLPASLQTIGSSAFAHNANLTGVTITDTAFAPSQLQSIGPWAFDSDKLGGELKIPKSLQSIGSWAFYQNQLTGLTIPEDSNLTSIEDNAFRHNQITGELKLPNHLQTIGTQAFWENQITGELIIPSTITSIAVSAFSTNQLTKVTLPEGLQTIGGYAFSHNQLTDVTIPSTVTSMGEQAFSDNQLTQVTLNEGLQTIGMYAFAWNHIAVLHAPESVTRIGTQMLYENIISGLGFRQIGNTKYEVNLKAQIPGFNPADYTVSSYPTDVNYNNTTGIFTFSTNDINNASFKLSFKFINSHIAEDMVTSIKNLQPYHIVNLDLQGGHFINSSIPVHFEVVNGKTIDTNIAANMAPDKAAYKDDKYQLEGWYTDPLYSPASKFDITNTPITSDLTLYANWEWTQAIQNPSVMVAIDQGATLTDYYTPEHGLMAKASINISLVETTADDKFRPTKNVVIKTDPHPIMERVNHIATTPFLQLQVVKPNGEMYTNPNDNLMNLNYFASSGNPTSAAYTVQTPIDQTKLLGDYTGNMTYTITLE